MSRVVDVRARLVRRRLHSTFTTALRSTDTIASVLVELEDADGVVGTGEAPVVPRVTGETREQVLAAVTGPLRSGLVGSEPDPHRVPAASAGCRAAACGTDVALLDLAARRRDVPVTALLGGSTRTVPTDVTLAAGSTPDALAAVARARVAEGFTALKLKVGTDAAADGARVRAVRDAVGDGVAIRLDANQGWTPEEAIRVVRDLEDAGCGVELVEQPVAATDLDGLARVTAAVDTPVMADEAVFSVEDLRAVVERGAAGLVNVKPAKAGGITPALAQLALAREHGLGTMVGSMMETGLGVAAAATVVAVAGTSVISDLDAAWWLAGSGADGADGAAPLHYGPGEVHLSPGPGLGPVPR